MVPVDTVPPFLVPADTVPPFLVPADTVPPFLFGATASAGTKSAGTKSAGYIFLNVPKAVLFRTISLFAVTG